VGEWGATKARRLIYRERLKGFELTAETRYGGTVTNEKRKRVVNYCKNCNVMREQSEKVLARCYFTIMVYNADSKLLNLSL